MWGLPQKKNARRADKIRLCGHLRRYKKIVKKTYIIYKEILDEYLLTYTILTDKLNRLDQRIEELASEEEYKEPVSKLTCFLGIKTHTALSVIVEVGDFQRFASARKFAGYLGLVPGQHSSGDDRNGLGITKAGNTHVRRLLVESAQSYTRGKIGYKSRVLRSRQAGNSPQIINYADRANERLRRRYYQMVLKDGKKYNIAKIAVARELACFIWGMMTDNIYWYKYSTLITISRPSRQRRYCVVLTYWSMC